MTLPRLIAPLAAISCLLLGSGPSADANEMHTVEEIKVLKQTEARFPGSMRVIGVREGHVSLVVAVRSDGSLGDTFILQSSRKAFTQSALKSLGEWSFAPATCNGSPIDSSIQIDLTFDLGQKQKWQVQSPMAASQARAPSSATPIHTTSFDALDKIPLPLELVEPENSPEGRATIEFYIDENGTVRCPRLIATSHLAFGKTMLDTVIKWKFEPPLTSGAKTNTMVRQVFTYQAGNLTASKLD